MLCCAADVEGAMSETRRPKPGAGAGAVKSEYQTLLDHLPVGVFRSRLDGTYLDANDAAVRMVGCRSLEELWSLKAGDLYANPEERRQLIRDLLEHGTVRDLVVKSRRPEDSPRWISISAVLMRDPEGKPDSILGITEDVTERRNAQDALARREALYHGVVETSPDAIALSDMQGWFTEFNRRFTDLFGFEDAAEMRRLGINSANLVVESDLPRTKATLEQLLRGEPVIGLEARVVRKDGSVFPAEFSTGMLRGDAGEPVAFIAIVRDATERKRAEQARIALEEQLRQSHKMEAIGLLAGGVAHDLNNMLTPILGNGDLLLFDETLSASQRGGIEEIVKATKRARDLVRQLMAFGRKQTLDMRPLDVNEVVQGFQSLLRRTLRESIRIALELNASPGAVRADRGQLEQVLLNLALNAQDAMPRGGTLTIRTEDASVGAMSWPGEARSEREACVMLSVQDTGSGMDEQTVQHIFEPFFTTKEKGKGTGLGLATVYGIVRQHGGDIRVRSTPGEGTTFELLFPATRQVPARTTSVPPGPGVVGRGSETILVAEDDPSVRQTTVALLTSLGYRVLSASTLEETMRLATETGARLDLLLTDVIMPELGGRELYARLKAMIPGLKVVFMSGYASDVVEGKEELTQGQAFLQKPFTLQALAERVQAVLASTA